MKNYIKLSILSLSLVGFASCDMDAPNQSALEPDVIGFTEKLAESAIMSIHQSFGETNSYRGRFTPYYGLNTDVEIINGLAASKTPDGGKLDLAAYNAQPNNSQMNTDNNAYAKFYEGIERANMVIKTIIENGNPSKRSEMAALLGEAMTLRAVVYLDLIKGWGDVPYRFAPIDDQTKYLPRVDRDTIYKRLLSDLDYAKTVVAWPNGDDKTKSVERINRAFVRGLRARIALYAGGYSYRSDKTIRLSNDPDLAPEKMYKIAAEECQAVIDSCTSLSSLAFIDNFKALCQDDVSAGKESLWEIPFSDGRGRVLYTFGVKHLAKDQYTGQAQGGVNGPLPSLFYDYDVDDVRRNITCVPYEWSSDSKSQQVLRKVDKWCFGKLRYEWMNRKVTSTNDDGINFQYMRLADVYMMAAEAYNELGEMSKAWNCLEPVLSRALPAAKVNALKTKYTASKTAFFEGIVDQRKFEFAGEMLRKADLIRWNLIDTKMAEAKQKMNDLAHLTGDYADLPENLYTKIYEKGMTIPANAILFENTLQAWDTEAQKMLPTSGELLVIYGLNHGDTDEAGKALDGFEKTNWLGATTKDGVTTYKITDDFINGLYINQPSTHAIWPIWQTFCDKSNGMLDNAWLGL